jgi:NACHT domain
MDEPDSSRKIFYLLDLPGSGKSTVSKQLVTGLKNKALFGCFFFSHDTEETMSINSFCSAVSDAFARCSTEFKQLADKFKATPGYEGLDFEDKLKGLVLDPLGSLERPAVLIIDAVDECNNAHGGRDRLLDALHTQHTSVPLLRIFITGRPEIDIKKHAENSGGFHTFRELEGVNQDVEQYIDSRLQNELPEDQVLIVKRGADGLFIWARTACDLLLKAIDRKDALKVLERRAGLTDLYKTAMKEAMPEDIPSQRAILTTLGMILAAQRPLSIEELKLLSPEPAVVDNVINRLGSFLVCDAPDKPIRLVHITFRDFITNHSMAGQYFVQVKLGHYILALQSIKIIGDATKQQDFRANRLERNLQREVIEISRV